MRRLRRRTLLNVTKALAATLAGCAPILLSSGAPVAQGQVGRPNIILLITDDQDYASARYMPQTLELIADHGASFVNHFAHFPLCCPERVTLLTGQYPHNHGVRSNSESAGGGFDGFKNPTNALPVWLRTAGYRTAYIGKYLNGYDTADGIPPGWDHTEWRGAVNSAYCGVRLFDPSARSFRRYGTTTYPCDPTVYQTDLYARLAADVIRRNASKTEPFFLGVGFTAPHYGPPHAPDDPDLVDSPEPAPRHEDAFDAIRLPGPPSFNETDVSDKPPAIRKLPLMSSALITDVEESWQQRMESLLAVDDAVMTIVAALQTAGELDNTVIIFTSDNGFFHGEHRVPNKKGRIYDEATRLPLMMRGPGIPASEIVDGLVGTSDITATILQLAGATPGRPQDGRSLIPLLNGTAGARSDLLIEGGGYRALRTNRWLWVEYSTGPRELYDLVADPYQLRSLHADPSLASVRSSLSQRLAQVRSCQGAACP